MHSVSHTRSSLSYSALSLSDSALVFGLLQLLLAAALVHPQHGLVLQVGDDD